MVEGYCVKCKKKSEMQNPVAAKSKKGSDMIRGTCACGTKMVKFGKLSAQ